MNPANSQFPDSRTKLARITGPDAVLRREDIIWTLEYVKKKVADKDPNLLELSQPRLLENFHAFADIAMLLIHKGSGNLEHDRLKSMLLQAAYGLGDKGNEPF